MEENTKELLSMLNAFCKVQMKLGCDKCTNISKCVGDTWVGAEKELRDAKILNEAEDIKLL